VTAIANLATVTFADCEKVVTLNKAIATLTDQLVATYIWDKSTEAELKRLLGRRAPTAPIITTAPGGAYIIKSYKNNNDNYCWSHVYQVGLDHTVEFSPSKTAIPQTVDHCSISRIVQFIKMRLS
jgi:hypothetical protein